MQHPRNSLTVIVLSLALGLSVSARAAEHAASLPEAMQANPPGCTTAQSTVAEKVAAGQRKYEEMLGMKPGQGTSPPNFTVGAEISAISRENIFQNLWTRCGLSQRDRELVTMGILIALRAHSELRVHFDIALRSGLSRQEIEEVLYQASGYAGMPAAVSARAIAEEVLGRK